MAAKEMNTLKKFDTLAAMIAVSLVALNAFAWATIMGAHGAPAAPRPFEQVERVRTKGRRTLEPRFPLHR